MLRPVNCFLLKTVKQHKSPLNSSSPTNSGFVIITFLILLPVLLTIATKSVWFFNNLNSIKKERYYCIQKAIDSIKIRCNPNAEDALLVLDQCSSVHIMNNDIRCGAKLVRNGATWKYVLIYETVEDKY